MGERCQEFRQKVVNVKGDIDKGVYLIFKTIVEDIRLFNSESHHFPEKPSHPVDFQHHLSPIRGFFGLNVTQQK